MPYTLNRKMESKNIQCLSNHQQGISDDSLSPCYMDPRNTSFQRRSQALRRDRISMCVQGKKQKKHSKKHVCFLTLRFLIPSWFLIEIWIKGDEEFCLNILEGLSSCKNSKESSDFAHHAFVEVGSKIKGPRFSSQWYPTSESAMT